MSVLLFDDIKNKLMPIVITMNLMLAFTLMGALLLQPLLMPDNSSRNNNNYNNEHIAFALTNGQRISQKLNYAHFLPLTNNSNLHQVKVLVDYIPIGVGQYGVMKVYASNGTLVKTSSSPNGLKTIAAGRAQFATSLSDSMIKQVTVHIMFTDSLRNANYSNPINVKLNLGQIISPSPPKSPISIR
jgi:hypothetical protein